jgi:CheY-like chemotaxis protein
MSKSKEFWLVDDNEIDRVVNGRLVEAAFGGSVRKFKDGPNFLEALAADAGVEEDDLRPGSALEAGGVVVLLDIRMPGLDGFGVLERMEMYPVTALSRLTVFMLSATLDPEELSRAEGHPIVEALLPKPLDIHQLRGWMEQMGPFGA